MFRRHSFQWIITAAGCFFLSLALAQAATVTPVITSLGDSSGDAPGFIIVEEKTPGYYAFLEAESGNDPLISLSEPGARFIRFKRDRSPDSPVLFSARLHSAEKMELEFYDEKNEISIGKLVFSDTPLDRPPGSHFEYRSLNRFALLDDQGKKVALGNGLPDKRKQSLARYSFTGTFGTTSEVSPDRFQGSIDLSAWNTIVGAEENSERTTGQLSEEFAHSAENSSERIVQSRKTVDQLAGNQLSNSTYPELPDGNESVEPLLDHDPRASQNILPTRRADVFSNSDLPLHSIALYSVAILDIYLNAQTKPVSFFQKLIPSTTSAQVVTGIGALILAGLGGRAAATRLSTPPTSPLLTTAPLPPLPRKIDTIPLGTPPVNAYREYPAAGIRQKTNLPRQSFFDRMPEVLESQIGQYLPLRDRATLTGLRQGERLQFAAPRPPVLDLHHVENLNENLLNGIFLNPQAIVPRPDGDGSHVVSLPAARRIFSQVTSVRLPPFETMHQGCNESYSFFDFLENIKDLEITLLNPEPNLCRRAFYDRIQVKKFNIESVKIKQVGFSRGFNRSLFKSLAFLPNLQHIDIAQTPGGLEQLDLAHTDVSYAALSQLTLSYEQFLSLDNLGTLNHFRTIFPALRTIRLAFSPVYLFSNVRPRAVPALFFKTLDDLDKKSAKAALESIQNIEVEFFYQNCATELDSLYVNSDYVRLTRDQLLDRKFNFAKVRDQMDLLATPEPDIVSWSGPEFIPESRSDAITHLHMTAKSTLAMSLAISQTTDRLRRIRSISLDETQSFLEETYIPFTRMPRLNTLMIAGNAVQVPASFWYHYLPQIVGLRRLFIPWDTIFKDPGGSYAAMQFQRGALEAIEKHPSLEEINFYLENSNRYAEKVLLEKLSLLKKRNPRLRIELVREPALGEIY